MCCIFNSKTRKHEFINATTERTYLTTLLKKTKCDLVVTEACGPSGWINDLAISLRHKTLVCSTNEDVWKWSNVKRKTNKDDALKLARMAAMGELNAVHMPANRTASSVAGQIPKDSRRSHLQNAMHHSSLVRQPWHRNRHREKAWHSGRTLINSFREPITDCDPNELWKGELDNELTQLDAVTAQMEVIVECAWASLRYNAWAKEIYERVYGKQKTRKKKAAIALGRKIAVLA